jgi:hypothetical protein
MKKLTEGIDYSYIVPSDKETTVHLKILNGIFKDTVYQYGKVKFDEDKETGDIYLRFVYNIVETPLNAEELEKDLNFKNKIGDILVNIMEQNQGIQDEIGDSYIEESDQE